MGDRGEAFGHDLDKLDGPRYVDGYLPIVRIAYTHGKTTYEQHAFGSVLGEARRYGLRAEARQLDLEAIAGLVRRQQFPIVLVDRTFLDREFAIHAVIPVRFTRQFVALLDPLRGERRISRPNFARAHRRVNRWAVVCELRIEATGKP